MLLWSILIDVLFLGLFIWIIVFFTKYGLSKSIEKIGKVWLSLALTFVIGPLVTGLLEDMIFTKLITNAVYGTLVDLIEHNANGYNLSELFEKLPTGFVNLLDNLDASLTSLEAEFGSYTYASDNIIHAMAERIAAPCISLISTFIGLVLGFIVPFLFFKWLKYEIKKDNSHPFFQKMDRFGGFLVGVIGGYLLAMALALFTRMMFQTIVAFDAAKDLMPIYQNSFLFRFLGEFDIFGAGKRLIDTVFTAIDRVL